METRGVDENLELDVLHQDSFRVLFVTQNVNIDLPKLRLVETLF